MFKKLLIPFGHAMLLVLLHVGYFNLNWSVPLENEMMTAFNKLESYLSGHGKFDPSKYLFVNTGYDQTIIEGETEYDDVGTIVITNRKILAKFFEELNSYGNHHKYILCDINFDKVSEDDSALAANITKIPNAIFPANFDNEGDTLIKPLFDVKYAQADYVTYEGMVSKIRLYAKESRSKTLPLAMYEDCNQAYAKTTGLGLIYKGSYIPWSIYPRYFFNREKIFHKEVRLSKLTDMLAVGGTKAYNDLVRDRILVIGNFTNETHFTTVGEMPGTLILFNTYLTLEDKYHLLGWGWFIFALFSFGVLCFVEFIYKKERPSLTDRTWKKFVAHMLGLTTWCILVSLFSGLLFRVHITIIPVIIYIELFRHAGKLRFFK